MMALRAHNSEKNTHQDEIYDLLIQPINLNNFTTMQKLDNLGLLTQKFSKLIYTYLKTCMRERKFSRKEKHFLYELPGSTSKNQFTNVTENQHSELEIKQKMEKCQLYPFLRNL